MARFPSIPRAARFLAVLAPFLAPVVLLGGGGACSYLLRPWTPSTALPPQDDTYPTPGCGRYTAAAVVDGVLAAGAANVGALSFLIATVEWQREANGTRASWQYERARPPTEALMLGAASTVAAVGFFQSMRHGSQLRRECRQDQDAQHRRRLEHLYPAGPPAEPPWWTYPPPPVLPPESLPEPPWGAPTPDPLPGEP